MAKDIQLQEVSCWAVNGIRIHWKRRFLIAFRSISKGWMQSIQVSEGWMKSLRIGIQQIKATQDIRVAWIILNNQWGWRKSHLGNCIECRLDLWYSASTSKKGSICKKDSWRTFVQPQTDTTRVWHSRCCFDLCWKKETISKGCLLLVSSYPWACIRGSSNSAFGA
jgi:hypothetical protein